MKREKNPRFGDLRDVVESCTASIASLTHVHGASSLWPKVSRVVVEAWEAKQYISERYVDPLATAKLPSGRKYD
jgi:hypothetical protein